MERHIRTCPCPNRTSPDWGQLLQDMSIFQEQSITGTDWRIPKQEPRPAAAPPAQLSGERSLGFKHKGILPFVVLAVAKERLAWGCTL